MGSDITEEECVEIITYMYNPDDAEYLFNKLRKHYHFPKKPPIDPKKMSREEQAKLLAEKEKPIIDYFVF